MWRVIAFRGRERMTSAETFVRADTRERAIEIGREVLRIRIKGRHQFRATEYHPERDIAFRGFIAAT